MTKNSKEYAQALFELSAEGDPQETLEGINLLEESIVANPEYQAMLASPAIDKQERLAALETVFRGRIPDILMALLRMMVSRGHVGALGDMFRIYREMIRESQGEVIAQVFSAVPLSGTELNSLRETLKRKFRRRVNLVCILDRTLLGGVRVEVGGMVIDGSVRNKLDKIKEVMNS